MRLADPERLERYIAEGLITKTKHPEFDLWIYNYTDACVYKHAWNPVTTMTRGLILNAEYEIVARPFDKFFNVQEHSRSDLIFKEPFHAFKKMDGSLGIMYPRPDGELAIATRGSFTSEQAQVGTRFLEYRLHNDLMDVWQPRPGWTYCYEIIYPANRIVVDYGLQQDLCFLGCVHNDTGTYALEMGDEHDWPGWTVERFDSEYLTPHDLVELERPNEEGFVLYFPNSNKRMKAKLAEYVRVHRVISGTNTKRIWEWVSAGDDIEAHLDRVPDEMYDWIQAQVKQLRRDFMALSHQALQMYDEANRVLGPNHARKDFALWAQRESTHPGLLFALKDGKDIAPIIWKMLKPEVAEWPEAHARFEEAA